MPVFIGETSWFDWRKEFVKLHLTMYEFLARYYDQIHASLTADLPFVLNLAKESGDPILDLGCGTGRLLFPLAKAGNQVTGVDNSAQMLAIATTRLAAQPEEVRGLVTLWEKDIRSLLPNHTDTRFSLALLSYNTLLHIQEREIGDMLKRLAGLLCSGGKLFIDVENPFLLAEAAYPQEAVFETSFLDEVTQQRVEQWSQSELDTNAQTLTVTWQFRIQDREAESPTVQIVYYYLYPHQILLLLQQAGFRLLQMMGSYEGERFQEDSERFLLIAGLPE
ncbi:MAG: class I SAM-dependent methyltransferase [Candidatus Promineifilaceae bacterium]|jgi:SAM-dependent methyltransferase